MEKQNGVLTLEDIRMSRYKTMSHDQILNEIQQALHYLTTTELVNLHADISQVQLKRAHDQSDEGGAHYSEPNRKCVVE